MHVLVLASQKGGAGKTTLALHLAVAAEAAGAGPVAMIDTDPQGTLTKWWRSREANTPNMAEADPVRMARKLRDLKKAGMNLVVIDTPGRSSEAIRQVIDDADLVLVPVKPSAADLWAVGQTIESCRALGRPFAMVVCQATRGASTTIQTVAALTEHGFVAPCVVHNRVGFAVALNDGQTMQEIEPKGPGAMEIAVLWDFVQKRMSAKAQEKKLETV